jgi:hypothetical protein
LFYLRGLKGRSARLISEAYVAEENAIGAADAIAETPAAEGDAPAADAKAAPKAEKKEKKAKPAKS